MNMKFIAIVMTGLALTSVVESAEAGVDQRQLKQKAKIAIGLMVPGELNYREAGKLINAQRAINQAERQFKQSGGKLSAAEKNQLNNMLDAERLRIRNFRNN
jgi:hypothetical protein